MSEWKAKRFWKTVDVVVADGGWQIQLDGRVVKTPAKAHLTVPTQALAQAVAQEWDAQEGEIDPETMPLTRAVNSAVDKVIPQRAGVIDMLAAYGGTDLLCYRAEAPAALAARQAEAWDPLLDWAQDKFGARLVRAQGVMPVAQSPEALTALAAPLHAADAFALTALHDLITLPGSLIIGLAVAEGHISPQEAWDASRIDAAWQIEHWGEDSEAAALDAHRKAQFETAVRLLNLLKS